MKNTSELIYITMILSSPIVFFLFIMLVDFLHTFNFLMRYFRIYFAILNIH